MRREKVKLLTQTSIWFAHTTLKCFRCVKNSWSRASFRLQSYIIL